MSPKGLTDALMFYFTEERDALTARGIAIRVYVDEPPEHSALLTEVEVAVIHLDEWTRTHINALRLYKFDTGHAARIREFAETTRNQLRLLL